MSTAVFPDLAGRDFAIMRSALWEGSQVVRSLSGKRTAISYWAAPIWEWQIKFNVLRSGALNGATYTEFAQLASFYNTTNGPFDSFLFADPEDNTVTDQAIGTGDGTTKAFALKRTLGTFTEPILAPNTITNVKINGATQSSGNYSVSTWGAPVPGVLTFVTAPSNSAAITATFSFYWPVEFLDSKMSFDRFMTALWSQGGLTLRSLK